MVFQFRGYRPYADVTEAALSTSAGRSWTTKPWRASGRETESDELAIRSCYKAFLSTQIVRANWTEFISPKLTCEERICEKRFLARQFSIAPAGACRFCIRKATGANFSELTCAS